MTTESYGIAVPHGNEPDTAGEGATAGAHARARASLAGNAMTERVRGLATSARTDIAESWLVSGHPPPLGELWAARLEIDVPEDHPALRILRIVFNYFRVATSAGLYGLAWVCQEPARLLVALIAGGVFAALIATITSLIF